MPTDPQPSVPAESVFRADLLAGKCLFVTGGGSGIGLGICKAFARLGAKVGICGRTLAKLEEAAKEIRAAGAPDVVCVQADVRNYDQVEKALNVAGEKWGKLDVVVGNAAGNFMSLAEDMSANGFSTVIDIDLKGTFHAAKAGLPWLRKASAGGSGASFVAISATLQDSASPFQSAPSAAKAGIDALMNVLAVEWAQDGIRVNAIAPGPIEGTEGGPTGRVFGSARKQRDIRHTCPLGRFGTVDDIANTVIFLASGAGSNITGTKLVSDGLQWHAGGMAPNMLNNRDAIRDAMAKQKASRTKGSGGTHGNSKL